MRKLFSLSILGGLLGCTLIVNQQLRSPICGDGLVEEACDDANQAPGDGCDPGCEVEPGFLCEGQPSQCTPAQTECGNGEKEGNEECDDGPKNSDQTPDACRTDCTRARCGDTVLDSNEECDDGGTQNGDGCSFDCELESCGDSVVQLGEECDNGPLNTPDGSCTPNCTTADCGDGFLQVSLGEECDDQNANAGDGCDQNCAVELATICGNNSAIGLGAGSRNLAGTLSSDFFDDQLCIQNGSAGFEKVFLFQFNATGILDVVASTDDPAVDLVLYFRDGCQDNISTLFCEDANGEGGSEEFSQPVVNGQIGAIFVDSLTNIVADFTLSVTLQ